MASTTKIAIRRGTLGRRCVTERIRLKALTDGGDMRELSYQAGLVAGLEEAKRIFETLEENEQPHDKQ